MWISQIARNPTPNRDARTNPTKDACFNKLPAPSVTPARPEQRRTPSSQSTQLSNESTVININCQTHQLSNHRHHHVFLLCSSAQVGNDMFGVRKGEMKHSIWSWGDERVPSEGLRKAKALEVCRNPEWHRSNSTCRVENGYPQ